MNTEQTTTAKGYAANKAAQRKRGHLRILRRIIQIAAFVLFPGLFISTYSALRDVITAIVHGSFRVSALSQELWLLAAIFPITIVMGRFFCGFLCAFGAMGDLLWFLSGKLTGGKRLRIGEQADRGLKLVKYGILLGSIVALWTLGVSLSSTMDPWTIFGMYASVSGWSSLGYLLSVGGTLLLAIMLGSMLVERFFCRYLCPLGAAFSIVSRVRLLRLKKPRQNCGKCSLCSAKCSMGIALYQTDSVASGECIDCLNCIADCPRGNVTANPAPAAAASMAVVAMTGLYYAGSLLPQDTVSVTGTSVAQTVSSAQGSYTDGTYTGSASGYKGTTSVQVTVKNGNISAIDVLSTGDDQEFFSRAKSSVISSILSSQSTDVDTVSGATFSSNGIINAVKDALASAGGDTAQTASAKNTITSDTTAAESGTDTAAAAAENGTASSGTQAATATTASTSTASTAKKTAASSSTASKTTASTGSTAKTTTASASGSTSSGKFKDGTYTGSGSGFRGTTTVKVTVSGGNIKDITIASYEDDAPYFSRAQGTVISEILDQQSVSVDTVSGATFSSNSIRAAVADALGISFTNPNDSAQRGRGGPR